MDISHNSYNRRTFGLKLILNSQLLCKCWKDASREGLSLIFLMLGRLLRTQELDLCQSWLKALTRIFTFFIILNFNFFNLELKHFTSPRSSELEPASLLLLAFSHLSFEPEHRLKAKNVGFKDIFSCLVKRFKRTKDFQLSGFF